ELLGQSVTLDPKAGLERIHEIAPDSSLSWQIEAECPLFHQVPLPERFQNLFRVEVQIYRTGFAAQQLVLGPGSPTARLTMQRTLREIVDEEGPALATFTYRVRNVYYDRMGEWSEERIAEGSTLFIFPNPLEDD